MQLFKGTKRKNVETASQVFRTVRINLSPFTKDFRVSGASIEYKNYSEGFFIEANNNGECVKIRTQHLAMVN